MKVGYLVHNLNDPSIERRCQMLERGGATVRLAGFCRDPKPSAAIARWDPVILGYSQDAAMTSRLVGTLRASFLNRTLTGILADCDIILARNLEQLAIASRIRGDRPLVYECLDIHHMLVGASPAAKAIQFVEKQLLPGVDLLLISSHAFVQRHFSKTTLQSPVELLENKLLVDDVSVFPVPVQRPPEAPLCIGWFGMLRCSRTLSVLKQLAADSAPGMKILIAGETIACGVSGFRCVGRR